MDPILTPLLIEAGITGTFSIGSTVVSYASVVSSFILAAGVAELNVLLTEQPKAQDGHFVVRQPTPARQFAFGTCRLGGAVMLEEEYNGNLFYVAALCGHRISAIQRLFLNDDEVTVVGNWVQGFSDGRYGGSNIVRLYTRLGLTPETAYSDIVGNLPAGIWPATSRGDGIASLGLICSGVKSKNFASNYPYGAPKPTVVGDTALAWDPRDPAQDPANQSTWHFSRNPAIGFIWHKCFNPFGPLHDYRTAILPVIDWYIEAANVCDEVVPRKSGGTELRYTMGGSWTTETGDDKSVTIKFLAACDGWMLQRGDGAILFRAGKYRAPTTALTLTDDDICGFSQRVGVPDSDAVNRLYLKYTSPDAAYALVETTPIDDTVDQSKRGKIRPQTLQIEEVQSVGQISRLGRREMFRQSQKLRGTIDINLHAIDQAMDRWLLLKSNVVASLNNQVIEIRGGRLLPLQDCMTVEFIGSGAGVDIYDATTMEGATPPVPDRPASLGPPIPANVEGVAELVGVGTTTIQVGVSFDALLSNGVVRVDLNYAVLWRAADTGSGAGPWTTTVYTDQPAVSADRMILTINAVPGGTLLDIEVASINTGGTWSPYSVIAQVNTSTASTAPTPPTGLSSSGRSIFCVAPNSANFASVEFFIAPVGDGFSLATPINGPVYGSPNQTLSTTYAGAAGSFDIFATARNAGGTASTPDGPVTRAFV